MDILKNQELNTIESYKKYYSCMFRLPEYNYYDVLHSEFYQCSFEGTWYFRDVRDCIFQDCGLPLNPSDYNMKYPTVTYRIPHSTMFGSLAASLRLPNAGWEKSSNSIQEIYIHSEATQARWIINKPPMAQNIQID